MRTRLSWRWRAVVIAALVVVVVGVAGWGFDFGQILGGLNRKGNDAKVVDLATEAAALRTEIAQLRAKSSRLEAELAMTLGTQTTLTRQATELENENSQLKEELVFLQKLVADSNKQVGLSIQRLAVDRVRDDLYRYSLLVVRGGNPTAEFDGSLTLAVTLQPAAVDGEPVRPTVLSLPDDEPDLAAPLKLSFKYYQRVDGSFRVASGAQVRALTVRAYEKGQPNPRASRSMTFP